MTKVLHLLFLSLMCLETYSYSVSINYPTSKSGMNTHVSNGNSFFYSSTSHYDRFNLPSNKYIYFEFSVEYSGFYKLEANVIASSETENSFFVVVNDSFPQKWSIPTSPNSYFRVANSEAFLHKGVNKVYFLPRESNTKLADLKVTHMRSGAPSWQEHFSNGLPNWIRNNNFDTLNSITGSNTLLTTYVPSSRGSERVLANDSVAAANQYTLTYRVKFHNGFEFVKGGKLHGVGPVDPTTGCIDEMPESWSSRVMFNGSGGLFLYLYTQNRQTSCGTGYSSQINTPLNTDQWYTVSLYTRINSSAVSNDGIAKLFLDGKQISEVNDIKFRASNSSQSAINTFLFNTFHGGSNSTFSPSSNVFAEFDSFSMVRGEFPGIYEK